MKSTQPVATVKKRAKKASASELKSAVRASKKSVVLTAKKPDTKKVAKVKITNKTTVKDRMLSKMSKVEALHGAKKTQPKQELTLTETTKTKTMSLALLSPLRFPIDSQTVARQTARYSGMTFVTIGAICALFYFQLVQLPISALSQLGQVCGATDVECIRNQNLNQLELNANTVASTAPVQELRTESPKTPVAQVVSKPPAVFTVGAKEPLVGVVPINVTVSDATAVKLSVFFEGTSRNINLGSAKQENGAWVYSWNTKNFDNGSYTLKALITNPTGSYESVHTSRVKVDNRVVSVEEEEEQIESSALSQTNDTLDYEYNFDKTSITLSQEFPDPKVADNVKIYLVDTSSNVKRFISDSHFYSYLLTTNQNEVFVWKLTMKTPKVPSGDYVIRTERYRNGALIDIGKKEISISSASQVEDEVEPVIEDELIPNERGATISVRNPKSLSSFADVVVEAKDAKYVEVYAVNVSSINNTFLGLARKTGNDTWVLSLDTTQLPNSSYQLFARIGGQSGVYESNRIVATVRNERQTTPTETEVESLTERTEEFKTILPDNVLVRSNLWNSEQASTTEPAFNDFLTEYENTLQEAFQRYAAAIRSGNENSIAIANTRLLGIENEYLSTIAGTENYDELARIFAEYITSARARIEGDVFQIERIVSERTNESMLVDSDKDEVTDFDELYIYKTNPFSADTSGKGIPDGVAILNGLDPLSTDTDASIVFESPKDIGVIREDILKVENITAVEPDETNANIRATVAPAVISGKALPNSFVTIYIFSNPIIVTVKTEADGSWQYRFEKELEDGQHSVYVALTDNSGRIIARSEPFSFIKEAQAYTAIDEALSDTIAGRTESTDYSFFSSSLIYLVLSFAVITIGLVLLLLGVFLDKRRRVENLREEAIL
jgi:hypothetical protein